MLRHGNPNWIMISLCSCLFQVFLQIPFIRGDGPTRESCAKHCNNDKCKCDLNPPIPNWEWEKTCSYFCNRDCLSFGHYNEECETVQRYYDCKCGLAVPLSKRMGEILGMFGVPAWLCTVIFIYVACFVLRRKDTSAQVQPQPMVLGQPPLMQLQIPEAQLQLQPPPPTPPHFRHYSPKAGEVSSSSIV